MGDIKVTKGLNSFLGTPNYMTLTNKNSSFCAKFLKKHSMAVTVDNETQTSAKRSLVYDFSRKRDLDEDVLQRIIDLLLQLRASGSDQNVLIQNNTVIRQQILNQLKNELTNVRNHLTSGQVQKLEVASNNVFDEKTINDILKSLLEESKKKLSDKEKQKRFLGQKDPDGSLNLFRERSKIYTKFINLKEKYRDIINTVSQKEFLSRAFVERRLVGILRQTQERKHDEDLGFEKLEKEKPEQILEKDLLYRSVFVKNEDLNETYREKTIIDKYTEIFKRTNKLVSFGTYLESRNFGNIIKNSIEDKYQKFNENFESTVLSNRTIKKLKFINFTRFKEEIEEKIDLVSRVDTLEEKTKILKRKTDEELNLIKSDKQNIFDETLTRKKVLKDYQKYISKTISEKEIEKILENQKLQIQKTKRQDKVTEKSSILEKVQKISSYLSEKVLDKNLELNNLYVENLKKTNLDFQKTISEKYELENINSYDKLILERKINHKKLVNRILENNFKLQDIETYFQDKREIVDLIPKVQTVNKVFKDQTFEKFFNEYKEYRSKTVNKHTRGLEKKEKLIEKTKIIDLYSLLKKYNIFREFIKEKNKISSQTEKFLYEDKTFLNQTELLNRENVIHRKQSTFDEIIKGIDRTYENEIVSIFDKKYIGKVYSKIKDKETKISDIESRQETILKNISNKQTFIEDIVNKSYKKEDIDRNIERIKNIIVRKEGNIFYTNLSNKFRKTITGEIEQIAKAVKSRRIMRSVIDENVLGNLIKKSLKIYKKPNIVDEKLKNILEIDNFTFKRKFLSLPDIVNKSTEELINQKNLYRQVEETEKSYFNNLQESLREKILLNRKKISNIENFYREIEREKVVHKNPISMEVIREKLGGKAEKQQKVTTRKEIEKKSPPIYNYTRPGITVERDKETGLSKKEILDLIKSNMVRIDIDSISEKVLEKVEDEMLSKRRRSGLI